MSNLQGIPWCIQVREIIHENRQGKEEKRQLGLFQS